MTRYNKYKVAAKPDRTYDGIVFDSKKEMKRYCELKFMEAAGAISSLKLQPKYRIVMNLCDCGCYIADFSYVEDGKFIVEDVKGVKTPVYKLKKKLVEASYDITITEV